MKKTLLLAALLAAPFLATAGPINLIQNGSFEATAQAPGTWNIYNTIPGWQVATAGVEIRNNQTGLAGDGSNFVELDTTSNSSIWQSLTTASGQSYLLSFLYSPRTGVADVANTNDIVVTWNGVQLDKVGGAGGAAHSWQEFSYLVTGSGNDVLRFNATGKSDSLGGSLDRVSLVGNSDQNASVVPEPASLALVMTALLGGGLLRRRQGAKKG